MRHTGAGISNSSKDAHPQSSKGFSYENLAGSMAAKMTGLLHARDPRGPFPPFHLVIVSQYGSVLFDGEVNKKGKVVHGEAARQVRRSHFPATVFLTDRSQTTRTFQIVRTSPSACN